MTAASNRGPMRMRDSAAIANKSARRRTGLYSANVHGGSGDEARGTWCTPKRTAEMVGPFDLDPFSNPRSHIVSTEACTLEHGDDGFGDGTPGSYFMRDADGSFTATHVTRVWIQPPYNIVLRAFAHYEHTRWCCLLRFDPSTAWFRRIYRRSALVCVPIRRINFEPPPGVRGSSQPFPHALFYKHAEDATPAVLRACIAWRPR